MKKKKDTIHKDLLIRVLEHCYKKGEFTIQEIQKELSLNSIEVRYIENYKSSSGGTKQMFEYTRTKKIIIDNSEYNVNAFRLTPNAIFNYLEYVELVHAKKNARQSLRVAIVAIVISSFAIIIPIIRDIIEF